MRTTSKRAFNPQRFTRIEPEVYRKAPEVAQPKAEHYTRTAPEGFETRVQAQARINREEAEAKAATQRQNYLASPEGKLDTALQQNDVTLRKFWGQPFFELREFENRHFPADVIGDYTVTAADDDADRERAILAQFLDGLSAQGISFPEDGDGLRPGMLRFFKYFTSLRMYQYVGMTPENLLQALQQLVYRLRAFEPNPGELSGTVPKPDWAVEAPKPAPDPRTHAKVIADLMERTTSTSHVWKKYVDQGFEAEFTSMFSGWCDSLRQNFGYEFPTERLGRKAVAFLERNGLSPFVHASWDKIRVAFVKSGDFPNHMLTPQERLCLLVDEDPRSTSDYAFRREIGRRGQELMDSRPPLPPHK